MGNAGERLAVSNLSSIDREAYREIFNKWKFRNSIIRDLRRRKENLTAYDEMLRLIELLLESGQITQDSTILRTLFAIQSLIKRKENLQEMTTLRSLLKEFIQKKEGGPPKNININHSVRNLICFLGLESYNLRVMVGDMDIEKFADLTRPKRRT